MRSRLALWGAALLLGGLFAWGQSFVVPPVGTGGGGGSVTGSYAFATSQFSVSGTNVTIKDGAELTNGVLRTGVTVAGTQTNTSTIGTSGNITAGDGAGGKVAISGASAGLSVAATGGSLFTVGLASSGPGIIFDSGTTAIYHSSSTPPSLGSSSKPFNKIWGTNLILLGLTPSRAMRVDASGNATNVTSADPSNEYVKADGTTGVPAGSGDVTTAQLNTASNAVLNLSVANDTTTSNGVVTLVNARQGGHEGLTNLTTLHLTGTGSPESAISARVGALYLCTNSCTGSGLYVKTNGTGNTGWWLVQDTAAGGSGGTNYPPVIAALGVTNITVGSGVRQFRTFNTNGTFGINFSGTPLNGETITVGVSNHSGGTIYVSNYVGSALTGVFYPPVASNVTAFAIGGNSVRYLTFVSHTNFNNGSARWEVVGDIAKELELAAGGYGRFSTNGGTITHYRAFQVDYIDAGAFLTNATNWAATFHYTNHFNGATPQVFYSFTETASNAIHFRLTAPAEYDGTPVKAKFHWTSLNTTASRTNTWVIYGKKLTNIDWDNTSDGTPVICRSPHSGGKEMNLSPATGSVTLLNSPVGGELVGFKVIRDPEDANDNMNALARLHAVEIQWGLTNAVVSGW